MMKEELNDLRDALREEAYEWAYQRAREEGDVDIDYDYEILERWHEEYYLAFCRDKGIEPYTDEKEDE